MSSNKKVEEVMGDLGIICVEDLVSELYQKGSNFDQVANRLCTFKLNKPTEGYGEKHVPQTKGGAWGLCQEKFNTLVESMI